MVGEKLQCDLGIGSEIDGKLLGFQYQLKLLRLRRAVLDNENRIIDFSLGRSLIETPGG